MGRHISFLIPLDPRGEEQLILALLLRMRREGDGWRLALAAAGHPPAIHVRQAGMEQLGGGTVLGGWPNSSVQRHDATLRANEIPVLCTDGWLEVGPSTSTAIPPSSPGRSARSP